MVMRIILLILFITIIIIAVLYLISLLNREKEGFSYTKLFGLAFMLYSFITIIGNSFY